MKTFKILSATFFLLAFFTANTYSQGCSDAGFCTMNSFKPGDANNETPDLSNQFKFGTFYGNADYSIAVYGAYMEYNRLINNKLGMDIKLTSLAQNGNSISEFGISDIFLNANYQASEKIKFTLGAKIPLSDASQSLNNIPLPMDYQASLGTFDVIAGLAYQINKLQLVAAFQQPLTQNNNAFFASAYPPGSKLSEFQSTNKFVRSGDVLLRASYPLAVSTKFKITPSILPVYHLGDDEYTDELNVKRKIAGSKGLTLNGNLYFDYEINDKNALQLNMGTPFINRDTRPDGLTRKFIANLEYRIRF